MAVADLQLNCPKTRPLVTAGTEQPVGFADLFRIGNRASSRTIGPMKAAAASYRESARGGLATNLPEC